MGRRQLVSARRRAGPGSSLRLSRNAVRGGPGGLGVWNEPNLEDFLKPESLTKSERADRYAEMLSAVYPIVKEASPSLPVIGGAVECADADFLEMLYDRGLADDSDAVSFHPYG